MCPTSWLGWFVTEQKVPALIVFFTIFEAIIYGFRYSLPLADRVGIAGRPGLPKKYRKEYEQAGQLLDEVQTILKKSASEIKEELDPEALAQVENAMKELGAQMDAEKFSGDAFQKAFDQAAELSTRHLEKWKRGRSSGVRRIDTHRCWHCTSPACLCL